MSITRQSVSLDHRPDERAGRLRWFALALLAVAQLMLVLDVTVVNVALPDIGSALQLSRGTLPWIMTTYTVVFGGLMLLGGRLADLLGARRTMVAGLTIFILSSLMCGLASGPATLIVGRAAQGVGAAVLSPAALALVMAAFTGPDRRRALGVWAALAGAGGALGVILGGVLTSEVGWRWIFAINVPIGAVILIALPLAVTTVPASTARRLDVGGALIVTAGTASMIYGLINAGAIERRIREPLLSIGLLGRRPVAAGVMLMLAATGLLVGGFFIASFDLQRAHGYSALHVRVAFLPVALATIAGAHTAATVLVRVNARLVATLGLLVAGAGFAEAALWSRPIGLVVGLSLASLGIGVTFVTAFTSSLADADPTEGGLRSAIVNTFHEIGGALGVAVLSSVAGTSLAASTISTLGFRDAFWAGALGGLGAAILAAALVPAVRRTADAPTLGH